MNVLPTNVSVPLIAPSVNIQTEQAARDNKLREPVAATVHLSKSAAEGKVKSDEKRRRQSAWDPSDHPEYELDNKPKHGDHFYEESTDPLERLFRLLSLRSYSQHQGTGYTMRFKLPNSVLDAVITAGTMERRRTVIKYHYGHAVSPNTPSEVIAVL